MKTHYSIIALLMVTIASIASSCDPPRRCNEPKCLYTNVTTVLPVTLSGNTDSIMAIGDTLRVLVKLPDTLQTNGFGDLHIQSILDKNTFDITLGGGDSIVGTQGLYTYVYPHVPVLVNPIFIQQDGNTNFRGSFDRNAKAFECLFIPERRGKYKLRVTYGRLDFKDKNGKEWSVNLQFEVPEEKRRYSQYLNWVSSSYRSEASQLIHSDKEIYWFEVE